MKGCGKSMGLGLLLGAALGMGLVLFLSSQSTAATSRCWPKGVLGRPRNGGLMGRVFQRGNGGGAAQDEMLTTD